MSPPTFGAADIMKLVGLGDGGIEECIVGLLGALVGHLSDNGLAEMAAILNGELNDRGDRPPE